MTGERRSQARAQRGSEVRAEREEVAPEAAGVIIGLNAVIVAVTGETPRILTVRRPGSPAQGGDQRGPDPATRREATDALPFGPLDPGGDLTLELGLRKWVRHQTGIELGYVEQLYTFGDRDREPRDRRGGRRVLSVGYLALVREGSVAEAKGARWHDWYSFLPWEDWREGRPALIPRSIAPALDRWVAGAEGRLPRGERRERVDITFGLGGAPWDGERVLERYELLYEAGLVFEARRDQARAREGGAQIGPAPGVEVPGRPMALDHRRILATALGRLRGKIRYRPMVFELLAASFTLLQLQRVVEALAGMRLHKQNFRRLVERGGLVEGTGRLETRTGGRPAELFRFRREVLRERPSPGVGLPPVRG